MTHRFPCHLCETALLAEDAATGADMTCPQCGEVNVVPPTGDEVEEVRFTAKRAADDDEGLDMTPMVDITFLLLIFFMVTAAFSLQKSIEIPPPDKEEGTKQARTIEEVESDDDFVIIRIDKDNTIWVDESEAPSRQELLSKLRQAREGTPGSTSSGPSSLLVLADGDARHETVVLALDAGNAVGMESIRLATVDEDDF